MEFTELPIPEPVLAGIRDSGFTTCTAIQELTLPLSLAGRDVAGQAKTGTGKTAAFLISCFTRLLSNGPTSASHHEGRSAPRCLIIAPTRELVVQIERDALVLGAHCGFHVTAVYGGVDYEKQQTLLTRGGVDVLIGTPGRLIDFLKQKNWTASHVEALVIDEADRMFDMGFIDDLRFMLRRMPPHDRRLSQLFSATLSYRAQELSYEHMNAPEVIAVASDVRTADQVTQVLYHVEGTRKISLLVGILRRDLAESEVGPGGRVMIFVNTKRMGERLEDWLMANGIANGYLSGDVPQAKRLKVLQRFQKGEVPVLIATDVAARGLHIEGVTHVINYDLPENAEDYVHRIGRTARAGAKGDAISLVDEDGAYRLEAVEEYIGMKIPTAWAEDELSVSLKRPDRLRREERLAEEEREFGPRRVREPAGGGRGGDRRPGSRDRRPAGGRREAPPRTPTVASVPVEAAAEVGAAPTEAGESRPRRRVPARPPEAGVAPVEAGAEGAAPKRRRRRRRGGAGSRAEGAPPVPAGEEST